MDWSDEQAEALRALSWHVEAVNDLAARGVLDPAAAEAQRAHYLAEAAGVAGQPLSIDQLLAARAAVEGGLFEGFFSFVNVAWFLVGGLLLVAIVWLVGLYLVPLIKDAPRWVHELLLGAVGVGLVAAPAALLSGGGAVAVASVGCLWLLGATAFALEKRLSRLKPEGTIRLLGALFCAIWGGVALLYGSAFIGGLAVAAFLALAGALMLPMWEEVHFLKDELVPLGMSAAALLLLVFVGLDLAGTESATLAAATPIFQPGAALLGGAAWFGGCLALASKHYSKRRRRDPGRWLFAQALAVISGVIALYVGAVYGPESLMEVGGTFLALYLLEKFFELPWRRHGFAWMCLALAGLLYLGASFAEGHPQYFIGL